MPQTDFAKLHEAVIFGQSDGKIIWQPRISCWFFDRQFAGGLPAPYTGMDMPAIYRSLGCSARIYDYNACYKRIEHPEVKIYYRDNSETDFDHVVETPVGTQFTSYRKVTSNRNPLILKREVTTEEELRIALWRTENSTWQFDQAEFEKIAAKWGTLGAPTMYLPRVNIQDLYINTMGVENATYALFDWPELIEEYFAGLDNLHDRLIDVINASPINIINFGDNLHCGTLPPSLFQKYVQPSYLRRCERLHRAGKFICSHWDGDTKTLLPFARQTGLDGIEAITPVPQGDVTLEEIKDALGDDMFYLDGIPAILFDELYDVSLLKECTRRVIELFAPKLVLGISDEMSSTGDIERIRIVGDMVEEYNAKL